MSYFLLSLILVISVDEAGKAGTLMSQQARNGLPNVVRRLKAGEPVTVAYLGGSITNGAGSSNSEKTSWRAQTTAWLRARFPGRDIREVCRNQSGMGSVLGVFRLDRDVLSSHPDLVFVEFAVNDLGTNDERIDRATEGIVRQILRANPATDICFVETLHQGMLDDYRVGRLPASVARHVRIAEHYGVPSLNVGLNIARRLLEGSMRWEEFSGDVCHPNDAGYGLFAKDVQAFLEAEIQANRPRRDDRLPAPLRKDCWESVALVDATAEVPEGWIGSLEHGTPSLPHFAASDVPGSEYRLRFSGDTIGVYADVGPDSGKAEFRIDDGPWVLFDPFQAAFHQTYHNATYQLIDDRLADRSHTLSIRIREDRAPQSRGRWTRIGYFLVNRGPK